MEEKLNQMLSLHLGTVPEQSQHLWQAWYNNNNGVYFHEVIGVLKKLPSFTYDALFPMPYALCIPFIFQKHRQNKPNPMHALKKRHMHAQKEQKKDFFEIFKM